MIVCVCNALKEKQVREVARQGMRSPGKVYRKLGCQLQCGQCVPFAQSVINSEPAIAC